MTFGLRATDSLEKTKNTEKQTLNKTFGLFVGFVDNNKNNVFSKKSE